MFRVLPLGEVAIDAEEGGAIVFSQAQAIDNVGSVIFLLYLLLYILHHEVFGGEVGLRTAEGDEGVHGESDALLMSQDLLKHGKGQRCGTMRGTERGNGGGDTSFPEVGDEPQRVPALLMKLLPQPMGTAGQTMLLQANGEMQVEHRSIKLQMNLAVKRLKHIFLHAP